MQSPLCALAWTTPMKLPDALFTDAAVRLSQAGNEKKSPRAERSRVAAMKQRHTWECLRDNINPVTDQDSTWARRVGEPKG